eukprot:s77_g17.t1
MNTLYVEEVVEEMEVERQTSYSTNPSGKSEREKVEEFTLQREIERLRSFYFVLQLAFATLFSGVILTALTELMWRNLPAGSTTESIISGLAVLAWFLTSASITIVSTCPIDELDLNSFMQSRPLACAFLAIPPLSASAPRVLERPPALWALALLPRGAGLISTWLLLQAEMSAKVQQTVQTHVALFLHAHGAVVFGHDVCRHLDRNSLERSLAGLQRLVSCDDCSSLPTGGMVALEKLGRVKPTLRFYMMSYAALISTSGYHACRGIEMALGFRDWEEGRQLDIAIIAALSFAAALLLPLLGVLFFGRRRLFRLLSEWLDQRRGQKLQDGAFMAMLLDSYLVELGQPWWLSAEELAADLPEVTAVAEDGSFFVKTEDGRPEVKVNQKQQVLPWPELLKLASDGLRCVDWVSQGPADWMQSSDAGFRLSRQVVKGEVIDFFVSHSWKWRALQLVAEMFYTQHGRYPTFWVDKFCIDQRDVADVLRVLPVNVMACRKVLVLCGRTYPTRLWCAWELCVLLSFMSLEMALKQLVVMPLSQASLGELAKFDSSELRLRRVITAIGQVRFESKIRAVGQLILDRELNGQGLMMDTSLINDGGMDHGDYSWDSAGGNFGERFRYQLSESSYASEPCEREDSLIQEAVRANTSYSLSPGVAKGPLKVVIGPVTLPQDPGEALLKGQVAIKNSKGEPVACIALDIDVPLAETRQTDEPSFCNKPTDHFKNASLTQSGEVTQLTGTLDEDCCSRPRWLQFRDSFFSLATFTSCWMVLTQRGSLRPVHFPILFNTP